MSCTSRTAFIVLAAGILLSAAVSYNVHRRVLEPAGVREDAFAALLAGRLHPDEAGVVELPARWASASIDGRMYVTRDSAGTTWALYVQERGIGAQFRGYAFCDRPATARVSTNVELRYPVPAIEKPDGTKRPAMDRVIVRIKRVLNPSAYEVVSEKK